MTYFGVLGAFVLPPLLALLALVPRDVWRWLVRRQGDVNWGPYLFLLAHVGLALAYTSPWDNYLVASGVWWYDPDLVTGISLGWVPIEEYTFFVVQTLLTGLWALVWLRSPAGPRSTSPRTRASLGVLALWIAAMLLLFIGWQAGTYLTLILAWALIPVLIQVAFGADILLANWRPLVAAVVPPTLYLWLVDAIAIAGGTWTIDPAQTTGLKLAALPLEEMVFFLMTNLIIAFGMTLMLSAASRKRARAVAARLRAITNDRKEYQVDNTTFV